MEKNNLNPQVLTPFFDNLKGLTVGLCSTYTCIEVSNAPVDKDIILTQVLKNKMSLIVLGCPSFNLYFRCFFNESSILPLIKQQLNLNIEEITVRLCCDYINEYCNLVAGTLKRSISQYYPQIGISVPISITGFQSLYFGINKIGFYYFFWKLFKNKFEIVCSVEIEPIKKFDVLSFNQFNLESSDEEDDDFFDL